MLPIRVRKQYNDKADVSEYFNESKVAAEN